MSVSKGKSEEWKIMCAVTLHWYRHGYFCLSRRGKRLLHVCSMHAHDGSHISLSSSEASWKARASNRTGKSCWCFLCLWDSSSVDWDFTIPNCKTVRVSDDPCHFRQVFLCGPVIPPVKWVVTTGLLGSLLAKWSHFWARYLQEKLLGTLTILEVKQVF